MYKNLFSKIIGSIILVSATAQAKMSDYLTITEQDGYQSTYSLFLDELNEYNVDNEAYFQHKDLEVKNQILDGEMATLYHTLILTGNTALITDENRIKLYFYEQTSKLTGYSSQKPTTLDKTVFVIYKPQINSALIEDVGGVQKYQKEDVFFKQAVKLAEKHKDYNFVFVPHISTDIMTNNKILFDLAYVENYQNLSKLADFKQYGQLEKLFWKKDNDFIAKLILNHKLLSTLQAKDNVFLMYNTKDGKLKSDYIINYTDSLESFLN